MTTKTTNHYTKTDIKKLRDLAEQGLTTAQMAEIMGKTAKSIVSCLCYHKIEWNKGGTHKGITAETLERLIDEGKTAKQIALELGVTMQRVQTRCCQLGIEAPWQRPTTHTHASNVYYELLKDGRILSFNDIRNRDRAYDYCRERGVAVYKSAGANADRLYDSLPLDYIHDVLTKRRLS